MMVFPSTLPRARAVLSNGTNYWAAYGPSTDNLLYTVYQDFSSMFTAFSNGQIDITDWPIQAPDLASYQSNPDFFVYCKGTTQCLGEPEFGIFQIDINHQDPLFNTATASDTWQVPRGTLGTPSLVSAGTAACSPACPTATFQLIVVLQNLEEANAVITDSNNLVSACTNGATPCFTQSGSGGTYNFGFVSDATGITSYLLSTSIYTGTASLNTVGTTQPVCPTNTQCTFDLRVNYNSGSTVKPSTAGIDMFRALSHLVNKPVYLTGAYLTPAGGSPLAACVDVQAPPAQNLFGGSPGACNASSSTPASTLNAECSDPNIAALGTCAPVSLYNLKSNTVVGNTAGCGAGTVGITCFPSAGAAPFLTSPPPGYASNVDLAAACIYFVEAGFTTTATGTTTAQCQSVAAGSAHINNPAGSCTPSTGVGCVVHYPRTDPKRAAYGLIVGDELNWLFGTPAPTGGTVCYGGPPAGTCSLAPQFFTIGQIGTIVFDVTTVADWNLYTGAFTLGSTPDQLWSLYHSQFGSNLCDPTATVNTQPNNYPLYCDPAFDTQANAGEFVSGVTYPAFQQAGILGATRGLTIAVGGLANFFAALNAWSQQPVAPGTGASLTGLKGHGFESGTSFNLNMVPVAGYTPSNSLYYASGCNPSTGCAQNTVRRSISQATLHISPYTFTTAFEADPLVQIYDSMLAVDVNTGGLCNNQQQPTGTSHCIDWMTTKHSISPDSPVLGETTQQWNLRSDIFFHDGTPVTANDVCFSLLSFRDAPSANFLPAVSNVISCTATSSKIVTVVLNGKSSFDELNIGGVFIVPEAVWAPVCGGLVSGTNNCVNPHALASTSFDPVAAGDMVGSGPYVCNPTKGTSTIAGQASCSQNANGSPGGQAIGPGGRMLLKRNVAYMRCCGNIATPQNGLKTTSLQALEWANFAKNGKVGITDIATAATVFGAAATSSGTAAYFANPQYAANPATGTVDIGSIATIASYFDHGITAPYTPSFNGQTLTQYTPNVDPYQVFTAASGGGTAILYYQGFTKTTTSVTFYLPDYVNPPKPGDTVAFWSHGTTGSTAGTIAGDEETTNVKDLNCGDIAWASQIMVTGSCATDLLGFLTGSQGGFDVSYTRILGNGGDGNPHLLAGSDAGTGS